MVQNRRLGTPFVSLEAVTLDALTRDYDVVVDAVFGFSFASAAGVRPPFDGLLRTLRTTPVPVVAIDIPSGWDVEHGDIHGVGVQPAVLISLTAPKLCARHLDRARTRHLLAGRFIPGCARTRRTRMWRVCGARLTTGSR